MGVRGWFPTSPLPTTCAHTPCRSFMPSAEILKKKNRISLIPLPPLIDINNMTNMMQHKIKEAMEMQRKRSSSFKLLVHELNAAYITLRSLNNLLDRYIMNKTSKSSSNMQYELKDSIHVVNMLTHGGFTLLTNILSCSFVKGCF